MSQQQLSFFKYQGTGNDFIIPAQPTKTLTEKEITFLCSRKFGIGSDGLMFITPECNEADLEVVFHNPDGSLSFCGNGSRCALRYAHHQGWIGSKATFKAFDGIHQAIIEESRVWIEMFGQSEITAFEKGFYINTGAPHVAIEVEKGSLENLDLKQEANPIRWHKNFAPIGVNVNYFEVLEPGKIAIRTFEKGVEDETLSCGTGVTACALVYQHLHSNAGQHIQVVAKGGNLEVKKEQNQLFLGGAAQSVFTGAIDIQAL